MSFYASVDSHNEWIRVIHLAPGSFNDEIRMTLRPVHLIDSPPPQYEALSYVWGTMNCPRPALVNNKPFTITSNLDAALRHLRHSTAERVLWVDAVCINQVVDAEKTLQVQLMRAIYTKATKVTIWMGPADKYSRIVMDCVDENKTAETADVRTVLEAASSFCSRDWFTRTWVVQEFELASKEPEMHCGFRSTRLSRVHFFLSCLHTAFDIYWGKRSAAQVAATQQWSPFTQDLARSLVVWCGTLPRDAAEDYQAKIATKLFYTDNMLSLRQALRSPAKQRIAINEHGEKVTVVDRNRAALFPSVLSRVSHLEATYPLDKIYGILGLCQFDGHPILPDYTRSVGKVYSHAMAHIMFSGFEYGYPIWPVGMQSSKAADFKLPSWVPNFSKGAFLSAPAQRQVMGGLHRMCNGHDLARSMESTARCFPFVAFMQDYQTLYAGGVDIGTICESWPLWHPGCKPTMDNLALIVNQVQKRGVSRETLLDALRAADMSVADGNVGLCQAAAWSPARVLFLTDNGHIGVTEGTVKGGDLLVGLFGINFPVILRGVDGAFKMVNIAHVAHHNLGHAHIPRDVSKDALLDKYGFSIYAIQ